jgi:exonuclease SbcC
VSFSGLVGIDISNFRSIRGRVYAPLDAKVVLVHGENGAGKTSLLSAVELALTGRVDALRRADPNYQLQILNKKATSGFAEVSISTSSDPEKYRTNFANGKVEPVRNLAADVAEFFGERAYLPQSLLGQLLQIYQDSDSDVSSPLARFVSKLLGLDRLDAIEAGLKPLVDVRNVRKAVGRWSPVEIAKNRLEPLIKDRLQLKADLQKGVQEKRAALKALLDSLDIQLGDPESPELHGFSQGEAVEDDVALANITDRMRDLASVRREMAAQVDGSGLLEAQFSTALSRAAADLRVWRETHQSAVTNLQSRLSEMFPQEAFSADLSEFHGEAMRLLRAEQARLADRADRGQEDARTLSTARDQLDLATKQITAVDAELSGISSDTGRLSSLLAEISGFISDDVCPVCGRDYSEKGDGALVEHVHARARTLSSSAERLVTLSRSRNENQAAADRLRQQIDALVARQIDDQGLAELGRRTAAVVAALAALELQAPALAEGQRLVLAEIASQRDLSAVQQRSSRRLAIGETLADLAKVVVLQRSTEEPIEAFAARIEATFNMERTRLDTRVRSRVAAKELAVSISTALSQIKATESQIAEYQGDWDRNDKALQQAQLLRNSGLKLRDAVDSVRSGIIRREFNERLNRLWRDLFVRLAPSEEFVPAFRIPNSETQQLQPKLYTPHRDLGDEIAGGTPGAMLSAGNLNTAALTLFIALHLSVPTQLPWLLLDDPVQSMDDIHISHFAALLRTLSKEHGRQVVIAVHDRQLFEYLRLELSPAFPDDSLITLEMTRSVERDSQCFATRYGYLEETALRVA